jgi:hypothetical protein
MVQEEMSTESSSYNLRACLCVILCVQDVLVYKLQECDADKSGAWFLLSRRSFANPVHSILYLDVTGDGVKEFVILTLRGIHIMQVISVLKDLGFSC